MKLQIARPKDISPERLDEVRLYLMERWRRASQTRMEMVDSDYTQWEKAYNGTPLEKVRTVPFYKSSNFVVKLIRMYIDTFVARSLNIIFATKPLFVCDALPRELKESWEMYLNNKCLYEWDYYKLTRDMCQRGAKTGTCAIKSPWLEQQEKYTTVDGNSTVEKTFTSISRPNSQCIPFEDFYVYPITANCLEDCDIKFHRIRYSEERVKDLFDSGTWTLPEDQEVSSFLKPPRDAKRQEQQEMAGAMDPYYLEGAFIECHLKYSLVEGEERRSIVCLIHPGTESLLDLYFNPYPRNLNIFTDYKPLPREDFYYGESMSQLLGQSQEEASVIHNDRRNNSFISNSVVFKRKSGSLLPNPSTNWYPGKVFDLDDMDDLEVVNIGRNYDDMLSQEDYVFQLAEKLSGISDVSQGASSGSMGKRGVYNTMGTLALLQESNQRQDTNLRDVRETLSAVGCISSQLQAYLGTDDPYLETLPEKVKPQVQAALALINSEKGRFLRLEVKTSSAGANKEVERQNLLQIAQVLGQYGQTVQQMAQQLSNPNLNQSLRLIMNDVVNMQKWMATRLLRQFDEFDAEDILPDLKAAIEKTVPQGGMDTKTLQQTAQQVSQLPSLPPQQTAQPPQGGPPKPNA